MVREVEQALGGDLGNGVGTRGQCVKLAHVVEGGGGQNSGKGDARLGREAKSRDAPRSRGELVEGWGGGGAAAPRACVDTAENRLVSTTTSFQGESAILVRISSAAASAQPETSGTKTVLRMCKERAAERFKS